MSATAAAPGDAPGVYVQTAGATIHDREALASHYRSDFHRYNLKRKIAGLPPVTKEWFEARKEQLLAGEAAPVTQTWLDPLTRKRFGSENTYLAHVGSRKYKEAVARSGQPAPAPVVTLRKATAPGEETAQPRQLPAPYSLKAANGVEDHTRRPRKAKRADEEEGEGEEDDDSGWETASDQDEGEEDAESAATHTSHAAARGSEADSGAGGEGMEVDSAEWDPAVSLLDGHRSPSMEANLEYMWRKFGFYFPDAEFLADPRGLLLYLGAKLQQGGIPLYVSGLRPDARHFGSLHAVQRHMQDVGRCKMLWEGNEEEYEDFYDYSSLESDAQQQEEAQGEGEASTSGVLALAAGGGPLGDGPGATRGYELAVAGGQGQGGPPGKLLGSREFARYYRQRYRPADSRLSVATNTVLDKYRALGIATLDKPTLQEKRAQRAQRGLDRLTLNTQLRGNVNKNLPRNCVH